MHMAEASARAEEFDLSGAAERMRLAGLCGCVDADVAFLYLRGLLDAREAFRTGAPAESLAPVRAAFASLQAISQDRPGPPEVALLLLHAAAAAAQSERAEMTLYLDAAGRMESVQRDAGQPGAPVLGSDEVAGHLWLQLYQYADARRAYRRAVDHRGDTMRVLAGLARTAARLGLGTACAEYRALLDRWGAREPEPPEIADARAYVGQPGCGGK